MVLFSKRRLSVNFVDFFKIFHTSIYYSVFFNCKHRLRYGRERAFQSLPKNIQTLQKYRINIGLSAWDNPVTMMKTVQDNVESLEEVFRVLEGCAKGDLKKEELVRIGMTKKKELRAWKDGGFQARFMSTAAKL